MSHVTVLKICYRGFELSMGNLKERTVLTIFTVVSSLFAMEGLTMWASMSNEVSDRLRYIYPLGATTSF
jgi:hypothetical protein